MLVTTADLKTYLGITTTTEDAYLDIVRAGAEEAFKGLVGWRIESATYTEYLNGTGSPIISVRQVPVNSLTSVNVDSNRAFDSTTALTIGDTATAQCYLQQDRPGGGSMSGIIVRRNAVWPRGLWLERGNLTPLSMPGQGNVKVVYSGGYTSIPDDIKLAIYEACKLLRMQRTTVGPVQGESLGEYSYSSADLMKLQAPFLQPSLNQIVVRYRRLRLQ